MAEKVVIKMTLALFFMSVMGFLATDPETIRCAVEADTWIGMHRWENRSDSRTAASEKHGSAEDLIIKGRISFALFRFDLSAARGLTVSKAILRIHRKPDEIPLHTVGLSTVSGSGDWEEDSANFFQPSPDQSWAYPGSDLIDVSFAQGGSLYSYERAQAKDNGWWEVNVPPSIVHALLIGDQYGLMLCDEKGQTQTTHHIHSRESPFPPSLIVEGTRIDRTGPGRVHSYRSASGAISSFPSHARRLGRTELARGAVILSFGLAGDDAGGGIATGYDLRYSHAPISAIDFEQATGVQRWCWDSLSPRSDSFSTRNESWDKVTAVVEGLEPGNEYFFAARAIDEAGNLGPVSALGKYVAYDRNYPSLPLPRNLSRGKEIPGNSFGYKVWAVPDMVKIDPVTGDLLESKFFKDHRSSNSVWDADSSTVALFGSRNEFVAFQLAIEVDKPLEDVTVTVERPLFSKSALPEIFGENGALHLYREWFVPDTECKSGEGDWYPDPLIPYSGPLEIPSTDNSVPGQKVQPFFVDIYIPHFARSGQHRGELAVEAAGKRQVIHIELEVLPLRLPDELNFVVDLNCYGGVNSGWDLQRGTPEYRKLEHAYHRMAHVHRTNLDVLGYSHNGSTTPDHAPPLEGEGGETRVSSWADWDAHFSPLLDGSAFADLPRAHVPVPMLYLPFFENWPGSVRRSYKHDDPTVPETQEQYQQIISRHALESEPIQDSFSQEYQDRYVAVTGEFAKHIRKNNWSQTRFAVYFNNKYYWKRPSQGGRGISWWLLDEPNHRDDVLAISFLGHLTKLGLEEYPEVPIVLRTDISRVEWIRDLMPEQIDLNCISRRFFQKNRYLMNDRKRFGKEYWNYATSNHPRESNLSMRAWCWRVYLSGGDGLLPWNAVRGGRAWERAEQLTVFYPGNKFGVQEPFASMRLKAYRRGQQDIEYLILLADKDGWDRDAVVHVASTALDLTAEISMESSEDAGQIRFQNITNSALEELRWRVAKALLQ